MTNAHFASLHGLPVGPVSLSTTPVPLRKVRARHERHCRRAAGAAGFRLLLGGGVALRLRFAKRFSPLSAPLSPLADRRPKPKEPHPQTEAILGVGLRQAVIGESRWFDD